MDGAPTCAWQHAKHISWVISFGVNARGALSQVSGPARGLNSGSCALNYDLCFQNKESKAR